MGAEPPPLVVQYLYVHGEGEAFFYPTSRSGRSAAHLANRYLECALTQAATLRLREADCDLALVTNLADPSSLPRAGARLMACIESLGVKVLRAEYLHRPVAAEGYETFASSRYVLDAILAAAEGQPANRQLWLTDLDCVWVDAARVFGAAPPAPTIGCVQIGYPPDWDVVDFGPPAGSRVALGELALGMGGTQALPSWIGGELLTGTPEALRALVSTCEEIDERLAAQSMVLATEEQTLTLAGALELARFENLSPVAGRIWTGPRHGAANPKNPLECGLWHLPSEKGLSLRRAANEMLAERPDGLRRDLANPARAAQRFNVSGTGLARRLRDDGWLAKERLRGALLAPLGMGGDSRG
jgi:hypothetical protein